MPGGNLKFVQTSLLEIAYEDEGAHDGPAVMLLHGWPDAPRGWRDVAQALHAARCRTIAPYLRGLPPTRFLSKDTSRVGAAVKIVSDEAGRSMAQVALAWLRFRSVPVIPLIGARRLSQLQDNLASFDLTLSED